MKAEYEYSDDEVLAIVLDQHVAKYPPPEGMIWVSRFNLYSSRDVKIKAVEKEPEGGAG